MNIKLRSKNFEITPAINDYITKKISTLEKFLDSEKENLCEVEIGRTTRHHIKGEVFQAEINIIIPGNKQVYAVAEEVDLYTAIDIVREEAERAIVAKRNRYKTLWKKGAYKIKDMIRNINFRKK